MYPYYDYYNASSIVGGLCTYTSPILINNFVHCCKYYVSSFYAIKTFMILPVHNVTGTRCTICVYVLVMYNMCLCASHVQYVFMC